MARSLRAVLYNDAERRLRAPWRLAATVLVFAAVVVLASVLVLVALPASFSTLGGIVVLAVLPLVATGVTMWVAGRTIDRREFADFGLGVDRRWWLDCAAGAVLGAALMAGVFLAGYALGWFRIEGFFVADESFLPAFLALTGLFLSVGIYEELLARGYLLTNLAEGFRFLGEREAIALAVGLSSVLFGVLHATNPGADLLSTVTISLAGVMFAAGYLLTGELGLPIGIHVTWNLFQGPVFGFGVSGLDLGVAVIDTESVGPEMATGGAFGPEAGLLGITATVLGILAIGGYVRWRDGRLAIDPGLTDPTLRTSEPALRTPEPEEP